MLFHSSSLHVGRVALVLSRIGKRRSFFASSTDHTRLLNEAEVHRLDDNNTIDDSSGTVRQYVLVDYGMDVETVRKVPQLHLGRLFLLDGKIIYGAKVVNETLGDCTNVCGRLLEAALEDARKVASSSGDGDSIQALATLHGLSDYVLQQADVSASVTAIAQNKSESTNDAQAWESMCRDFVEAGQSSEAILYQAHGGTLSHVEHQRDTSDYANTCAGSMAVFRFP